MSEVSKSSFEAKVSAGILIAALIVFTAIAAFQTAQTQWAIPKDVRKLLPHPNHLHSGNSTLLVTATRLSPANFTPVPGINVRSPIVGANISVYNSATTPPVLIANSPTDNQGSWRFEIPAAHYIVHLVSSIANVTASVVTNTGNTTDLQILVNETVYSPASFVIENTGSSQFILPWESVLLRFNSNLQIQNNGSQALYLLLFANYLIINASNGNITTIPLSVPQQISSHLLTEFDSLSQNTTWLGVQPYSVVNIAQVYNIDLLTVFPSYSTTEYATNSTIPS